MLGCGAIKKEKSNTLTFILTCFLVYLQGDDCTILQSCFVITLVLPILRALSVCTKNTKTDINRSSGRLSTQ